MTDGFHVRTDVLNTKFGIVAMVDALGSRTAGIDSSRNYLNAIRKLEAEITSLISVTLSSAEEKTAGMRDALEAFNPRFFGDTILCTYEVADKGHFHEFFARATFVLNALMCYALDLGVLFRGALSVGEYLESQSVALGPAVVDVASWYEMPEFIGVIVTPSTANYLKADFRNQYGEDQNPIPRAIMKWDVPVKNSGTLGTFALNWPTLIRGGILGKDDKEDKLLWFYNRIKNIPVPFGTERKYHNTERFLALSIEAEREFSEQR
jgi:hypothetical protein